MRGCVRSCSRRQRRPQHHPEPRAGPASACPAAAVAISVPATVPPKQLPLHGQANLCDRLLFFFLFQLLLLLLPLPICSRKPLTQLTLAQPQTVSPAQLHLAPRAPLGHWTHRLVFYLLQSCIAPHIFAPTSSLCLSSALQPCSLLPELRPSAPAGQRRSPPSSRAQPLPLGADDAEDALLQAAAAAGRGSGLL